MQSIFSRVSIPLSLTLLTFTACAGRKQELTTPEKVVEMEGVRIVAKQGEGGAFSFDSYDAEELFKRGNEELERFEKANKS